MTVGVVVIGRNEGERLRRCLDRLAPMAHRVVYVDSGSSDGSVALAHRKSVTVIELDMSRPFTAGRARNAGFMRLRELVPDLSYVQFVDGDCELADGWLDRAAQFLSQNDSVAVVSGRLREKFPRRTLYNMLCDIEWDTPVGHVKSCGGIAMHRASALEAVRGFRPDLIAGEEPELCVRLRAAGWRVWRLEAEMAHHDVGISRFGQWWKRTQRTGYAYAAGAALHGAAPERHWIRESRSAWLWAVAVPALAVACATAVGPQGLAVFAIYPAQIVRLALRGGLTMRENWWRALFLVIGKFPEMLGQLQFYARRYRGTALRLIEYK